MDLEQAQRLSRNDDFIAFLKVLSDDIDSIKEDLIYQGDPAETMRTQCKIIVLRGVSGRLNHVIESLSPEPTPASEVNNDNGSQG